MLISLVSGTYNRLPYVQDMVQSFRDNLNAGIQYEVILVDGGSTDGTVAWAEGEPDITLIHGDLSGAIKAFNTGAEAATGKYVLLANDDITFFKGSIMPAILHLENNNDVGAVAFADNRHWESKGQRYGIAVMHIDMTAAPERKHYAPYAQVGLFRRWLGDLCNWWGYGEINAKTYGGDNLLSGRIWEKGYKVDEVEEAKVHDHILEDALRAQGREFQDEGYYEIYPSDTPPVYPGEPVIEQQDKRCLRILYLPIFEHPQSPAGRTQARTKRGLRQALAMNGRAIVWEIDYLNTENVVALVAEKLTQFQPDIIVSQFHGADTITTELVKLFRYKAPRALVVNWNGDYWPHGLTSPEALAMLRNVDLQLTVNAETLPVYEANRIPAAYWQIGWEPVDENALPEMPSFDVVFLGNNNHAHELRPAIEAMLESLQAEHGISYGLFGDGWNTSQGNTLYDFAKGRAIYNNAKLAISDTIPESKGFVSNRFFEAYASNVTILQQRVELLDGLIGTVEGKDYYAWDTVDDLKTLILEHVGKKHRKRNQKKIEAQSFEARVIQLLKPDTGLIYTHAERQIGGVVTIVNIAAREGGGLKGPITKTPYRYEPGIPLQVDSRDAQLILKQPDIWQQVGG